MAGRVITLTTDFGTSDGFVGTMKGVILGINPEVTVVDIAHEIAPQNIEQGAFLFAASARYFPKGTIHVVVVDPGVGSSRRAIALEQDGRFFVAPDNGVLTWAIGRRPFSAVYLNRPEYWLPNVSNTFHGRDIFAPAAAHLSLGVPLEALGELIEDWVRLPSEPVQLARGPATASSEGILWRVIHIDRFGNIVINLAREELEGVNPSRFRLEIAGQAIQGLSRTFSEVSEGELLALVGSSGFLEVGVRNGSAARLLGVKIGDPVRIVP